MRVCMKVTVSGTRDGEPWPAKGGIVDLPDDEAKQLLAAGMAVEPAAESDVEEATAPAAETSTPAGRKPAAKPK